MLIYAFLARVGAHVCECLQVLFALRCSSPAGFSAYHRAEHMALQSRFTRGEKAAFVLQKNPLTPRSVLICPLKSGLWILQRMAAIAILSYGSGGAVSHRCSTYKLPLVVFQRVFESHVTVNFLFLFPPQRQFSWCSCPAVLGKHRSSHPTGVCPRPRLCERVCVCVPNLSPNHAGLAPIIAPDVNVTSLSNNEIEEELVYGGEFRLHHIHMVMVGPCTHTPACGFTISVFRAR